MNNPTGRSIFSLPFLAFLAANLSGCAMDPVRKQEQFTCTPTKLFRCEPEERSCMTIPIISSLGNVQITIDLANRKTRSFSEEKTLTSSDIDTVKEEDGLIYFDGKGYGFDKTYRAWTAIIDRSDGGLYVSSITTGAGHVTYGKCYEDNH